MMQRMAMPPDKPNNIDPYNDAFDDLPAGIWVGRTSCGRGTHHQTTWTLCYAMMQHGQNGHKLPIS